MKAILTNLNRTKRRRSAAVAVVVFAVLGLALGLYFSLAGSGEGALEENQRLVPVRRGDLENRVSISGSVAFPQKAVLSFGSSGVVTDVLVEEGQSVTEGQLMATLDPETIAALRAQMETERVNVKAAEKALAKARDPSVKIAEARLAVLEADIALRKAAEDLDRLRNPDPTLLAEAEGAVVSRKIDVEKAREALQGDVLDAASDVTLANKGLDNARRGLELARDETGMREAQDAFDEAGEAYVGAYLLWLGVELAEEEASRSPGDLFDDWGLDLEAVFDRSAPIYSQGVPEEDPDTRWSERTTWAWFNLHPSGASLVGVCGDDFPASQACVQRAFDDAWDAYRDAESEFARTKATIDRAVDSAESEVIRAEETLANAEKALESITGGLSAELLKKNLDVALAALGEAEEELAELVSPDPLDIEKKTVQVVIARAAFDEASEELADLMDGGDSLEIGLREAELVAARAALDGAIQRYENSTLKAPWDGFVATIHVEVGDELGGDAVSANAPIIEVIDPNVVEVNGTVDEIDVLSVRVGANASVMLSALPDYVFEGTISSLSSAATNQQGVVTYETGIRVTVPEGVSLQEGLSAVANIELGKESGLLIPSHAVLGTFDAPHVLVSEGGSLEETPVVLGDSDGFWTVVRQGLSEGQQVVVEIVPQFDSGFGGGFRGGPGGGPPPPRMEVEAVEVEAP